MTIKMKAHSLKALYPKPAKRFLQIWKNLKYCKGNICDEVLFK